MASPNLTTQNGFGVRTTKVQNGTRKHQITIDFNTAVVYHSENATNFRDRVYIEGNSYPFSNGEIKVYGYTDFQTWAATGYDPAQEPEDFDILTPTWIPTVA